jgi:hypothetical protein
LKKSITTLFIIAGLVLIVCTGKADAQLFDGFCSACVQLVFDPSNYQVNSQTAASLTTGITGGWYQPSGTLLGNLTQTLFSGINTQNAAQIMPVTQGLPCDSYTPMVTQIAPALMNTYEGAISETQQLTIELQGENFSTLAASINAPAELAATQAVGQAVMTLIQETQLERAQLASLTMIEATDKLHQLDTETRMQMPRQGGGC